MDYRSNGKMAENCSGNGQNDEKIEYTFSDVFLKYIGWKVIKVS